MQTETELTSAQKIAKDVLERLAVELNSDSVATELFVAAYMGDIDYIIQEHLVKTKSDWLSQLRTEIEGLDTQMHITVKKQKLGVWTTVFKDDVLSLPSLTEEKEVK